MIVAPSEWIALSAFGLAALLVVVVFAAVPALATEKLQFEAERIRNQVLDACLDGKIDRSDPRLRSFLEFCHIVECHTNGLRLGRLVSLRLAARIHRWSPPADAWPLEQETLLGRYEHELDELVGDHLINGSRLWWLLWPLRQAWRLLHRLAPSMSMHSEASAYQRAVGVREEISGSSIEAVTYRQIVVEHEVHHSNSRQPALV